MKPPVTVIMPAHNAEKWIGVAIASVLRQTHREFDLWVLENGSTDGTLEVAKQFDDPRLKVFSLGRVGFQGALQYAIENAKTDWLARMDADDLMLPQRLQIQMEFLEKHPEFVFVGTAYALLTPFGHIFERLPRIEARQVDQAFLGIGRGRFGDPCTVFNRRAALETGGVDPEFTMGDVPLWFRLLTRGKGWQLGLPLHVYRMSPRSMSKDMAFIEECMRARRKYAPEIVASAFPKAATNCKGNFWGQIVLMELLAGDMKSMRQAIALLEQEGDFGIEARRMLRRSYGGALASAAYRIRYRNRYRRRIDWERDLAEPEARSAGVGQSVMFEKERGITEGRTKETKAHA